MDNRHPIMRNREKAIHALQKAMPESSLYNDFYFLVGLSNERLIELYDEHVTRRVK